MMDPTAFGRQLERLMDGHADDLFWLSHVEELSPCQLGAFYVAVRLGERRRTERRGGAGALDRVLDALGMSRSWVVGGPRHRDPRCTCEAIQSADATRHFKECPLRAEHPK